MNIPEQLDTIFIGILGVISGGALAVLLQQLFFKRRVRNAEEELQRRIEVANREAENIVKSRRIRRGRNFAARRSDSVSVKMYWTVRENNLDSVRNN